MITALPMAGVGLVLRLAFTLMTALYPLAYPCGRCVNRLVCGRAPVTRTCLCGDPRNSRSWGAKLAMIGATAVLTGTRRKRVVTYARYSTDEQSPRSIDDQLAVCRQHVEGLSLGDVEFVTHQDAAISGEHSRRPGIDQVWELIDAHGCDLIVAEDLSRFYRHSTRAMQFIESAVDAGVRVIAINSHIDTAEDEGRWRMGGYFASMKSEWDNTETRKRIIRAMEGLWRQGYAVGALKPGYARTPTVPATEREPARGPFRDTKDERWTPVIRNAYERVAQRDPLWQVAEYLTESQFPKSARARLEMWTEDNVRHLIRNPIYYGEERWRVRHSVKKFCSGRSVQEYSVPEQVLSREMPELAHVTRPLWEAANRALDRRTAKRQIRKGEAHPLRGIPRDSRSALSGLFVCGVCGAKMYRDPQRYRCANSRPQQNTTRGNGPRCWNRCLPQPDTVHQNLARAIVDALRSQTGWHDALCGEAVRLIEQGTPDTERRLKALREREVELVRACKQLTDAVEQATDIESVLLRLRAREGELRQVRYETAEISERARVSCPPPSGDDVRRVLDEIASSLLEGFGRQVGPLLRRLIADKIRAVPHMLFDRGTLHLRAHFTLNLLGLLPEQWQQLLEERVQPEVLAAAAEMRSVPLVVDLFKRPTRIRCAKAVYELVSGGLSIADAARRLSIPETSANRAFRTGKAMVEAGIGDPYIEVKSMPERPPRWRPQSDRPDVFDAA